MKVRNWMTPNPIMVDGDTLVAEAKRLLVENNLHGIPVVENGRLRGLITRANCIRAGQFVGRTQSASEFEYFSKRLKVKDMMIRRPVTVDIDDTIESTMLRGQELGVGQMPVLEQGKVVGMISASEIFKLTAHLLGAWDHWSGITIGPMKVGTSTLNQIVSVMEKHVAVIYSLYTVNDGKEDEIRVIVRLQTNELNDIADDLRSQGFNVKEVCAEVQLSRDGSSLPTVSKPV